jgi:hypothetical protein
MLMADITDGFDPGDDEIVVEKLKKWKGGRISTPLFTALAGMLVIPVLETVILRKYKSNIQILLISRPPDDIVWKGMIHSPGGALRRMDYYRDDKLPNNGVFERIEKAEIKTKFVKTPKFIGLIIPERPSPRGPELAQIFLAEIKNDTVLPPEAGWYNVDDLPKMSNFIQHQLPAVNMAVNAFKKK